MASVMDLYKQAKSNPNGFVEQYGPKIDETVSGAQKNMFNLQSNFADQRPELEQNLTSAATDAAKGSLADRLYQTKQAANSRGLLYSGIRQGAEEGEKAKASGDLAKNLMSIRGSLDEQQRALSEQAYSSGVNVQSLFQQHANNQMQSDLARQRNDANATNGFLGAAGQVGGAALGFLI
jgi:hypothetical protein